MHPVRRPGPDYKEINESHGIIQMALTTRPTVHERDYDLSDPGKVS